MTIRQPGTTAPGTTEGTGKPGPGRRAVAGQSWTRILPVALLILLGLVGLRGAVTAPHWNGPLRHDGLIIGVALEVVLGVLLVALFRRRARFARAVQLSGPRPSAVPAKLRDVLILVLGAAMIAVAVATDNLSFLFHRATSLNLPSGPPPQHRVKPKAQLSHPFHFHLPLALLYALLVAALVVAVLLSVWWLRRVRPPSGAVTGDFVAEDPEDLREAVSSGRAALRTVDDARAAIIACYVAMETSLVERGAAREVAGTPDELLARATATGLLRGTAPARLTALFYEARFSSHPLSRGQRDAAEQALNELAAALAEPAGAGAGP